MLFKSHLDVTENIRPVLEQENLKPSRDKIHDMWGEQYKTRSCWGVGF